MLVPDIMLHQKYYESHDFLTKHSRTRQIVKYLHIVMQLFKDLVLSTVSGATRELSRP